MSMRRRPTSTLYMNFSITAALSGAYVVIDAMDELVQLDLLTHMKRFLLLAGKLSLKVVITSRPRGDVISLTKQYTVLDIPRVEVNRDIRKYLNERLEQTILRGMKEEITEALCSQTEVC